MMQTSFNFLEKSDLHCPQKKLNKTIGVSVLPVHFYKLIQIQSSIERKENFSIL